MRIKSEGRRSTQPCLVYLMPPEQQCLRASKRLCEIRLRFICIRRLIAASSSSTNGAESHRQLNHPDMSYRYPNVCVWQRH